MRARSKQIIGLVGAVGIVAAGAYGLAAAHARELGRSNPQRAANYRPPLFNFSETYTNGLALGVAIGSTKVEAIEAAERGGFKVQPSCWGDSRAGGADLYERSELIATMLREPHLCFYDSDDLHGGMILDFAGDRVTAIRVHYINFEAI